MKNNLVQNDKTSTIETKKHLLEEGIELINYLIKHSEFKKLSDFISNLTKSLVENINNVLCSNSNKAIGSFFKNFKDSDITEDLCIQFYCNFFKVLIDLMNFQTKTSNVWALRCIKDTSKFIIMITQYFIDCTFQKDKINLKSLLTELTAIEGFQQLNLMVNDALVDTSITFRDSAGETGLSSYIVYLYKKLTDLFTLKNQSGQNDNVSCNAINESEQIFKKVIKEFALIDNVKEIIRDPTKVIKQGAARVCYDDCETEFNKTLYERKKDPISNTKSIWYNNAIELSLRSEIYTEDLVIDLTNDETIKNYLLFTYFSNDNREAYRRVKLQEFGATEFFSEGLIEATESNLKIYENEFLDYKQRKKVMS